MTLLNWKGTRRAYLSISENGSNDGYSNDSQCIIKKLKSQTI